MHIRNTYCIIKRNETQRILIFFVTHANFSTYTNNLWNHVTHATRAKILTHATFFDPRQNFMNPRHIRQKFHWRHPRAHAPTVHPPPRTHGTHAAYAV